MLSKYKRRPDNIEEMVSSHFGKIMKTGRLNISVEDSPDAEKYDSESDDEDYENLSEDEDPNEKFHFIITESDKRGEEIPNIIKLKDPFPKENPFMRNISFPAALRFHKQKQ